MKTLVRQHPLKPINLSFEEERRPAAFEVRALKQYEKAHDEIWQMKVRYRSRKNRLMVIKDEIEELYFGRLPLEQQLEIYEEALGIGQALDVPPFEGQMNLDVNAFFDATLKHNKALQRLHTRMVKAAADYNADVANLYEENYLIDPAYFEVLDELYLRHEELTVDIVSLDRDHQEFLMVYGEVENLREAYMEYGQEVFDAYSELHDESESFYRRAEAVNDRLDQEMGGD